MVPIEITVSTDKAGSATTVRLLVEESEIAGKDSGQIERYIWQNYSEHIYELFDVQIRVVAPAEKAESNQERQDVMTAAGRE